MATVKMGTRKDKCACQPYQLYASRKISDGAYIGINGPWDTYGIVTSAKQEADGRWLHQLRGVPHRPGEKVVHNF